MGSIGVQHPCHFMGRVCPYFVLGRRLWCALALLQRASDSHSHGRSRSNRIYASRHDRLRYLRPAVRFYAVLSVIFLFIEALLGAGLVLFRLVAHNQSAGRATYLSAHLTNTLLLLLALTATAWAAGREKEHLKWTNAPRLVWGALLVTAAVCITGAIAALGDTLFPAATLASGVAQDFSNAASLLLRLRLVHPLVAVLGAAYLLYLAGRILQTRESGPLRTAATRLLFMTLLQLLAGGVNIALLAPVWMQLLHLFLADVLWIAVVVLAMESATEATRAGERAPVQIAVA